MIYDALHCLCETPRAFFSPSTFSPALFHRQPLLFLFLDVFSRNLSGSWNFWTFLVVVAIFDNVL